MAEDKGRETNRSSPDPKTSPRSEVNSQDNEKSSKVDNSVALLEPTSSSLTLKKKQNVTKATTSSESRETQLPNTSISFSSSTTSYLRPPSPPPPPKPEGKPKKVKNVRQGYQQPRILKSPLEDYEDDDLQEDQNFKQKSFQDNKPANFHKMYHKHKLYGDEDDDYEDVIYINPSGSVLAPVVNPYNKQEKIRQANIALFKDEVNEAPSNTKIKFNDDVFLLESDKLYKSFSGAESSESETELPVPSSQRMSYNSEHNLIAGPKNSNAEKEDCSLSSTSLEKDIGKKVKNEKNDTTDDLSIRHSVSHTLLVTVPLQTNIHNENFYTTSEESSSSENEDVYVSNPIVKLYEELDGNNDDGGNEKIYKNKIEEKIETKKLNETKAIQESLYSSGDSCLVKGIEITRTDFQSEQVVCLNDGEGDACQSPENNTGIQIKITCPSCSDILNCVEFVNYKTTESNINSCMQSTHNCNKDLINTNSSIEDENTFTVLKPKNHVGNNFYDLANSKNHQIKSDNKNQPLMRRSPINNVSIHLNTKNGRHNYFRSKFYGKIKNTSRAEKQKNNTKSSIKKNFDVENAITDNFFKQKKVKMIKNKANLGFVDTSNKENEKYKENVNLTKYSSIRTIDKLKCNDLKKLGIVEDYVGTDDNKVRRRPESCKGQKDKTINERRPLTAPVTMRRGCSTWDPARLPDYNGFRSEYGLSEEQLQERKRIIEYGS